MRPIRLVEFVVVALVAIASIVAAWSLKSASLTGLAARYWNNTAWSGAPVAIASGAMPTAVDFVQRRAAGQYTPGSAEWTGWVIVDRTGEHQFDVVSDDGAWLFVDDRLVIDNGGEHGAVRATGRIALAAGLHSLKVRYFQAGAGLALDVWWTRPGRSAKPLLAQDVAPTRAAAGHRKWVALVGLVSVALPIVWGCLFLYVPCRLLGAWVWREVVRANPSARARRAVAVFLLLAMVLVAWRIDWGAAGGAWAPDELTPGLVRWAMDARFAGGWHDKYPLMHYVVLALPVSAFEIADRLSILPIFSAEAQAAQLLLMRAVSVLLALGTLIAVYLCGVEMLGPRRGMAGAIVLLLTPLFVYYGKTANLDVPSLCWFAWAVLAVLRILARNNQRDYVMLGVAAAAAVATKDQMYASVALLPIVPLLAAARAQRSHGWGGRLGAALLDRRLVIGAAAAIVAFALFHNIAFNFSGFVAHVQVLSTFPSLALVPRSAGGYAELTMRTITLFRLSLGWPFFLLSIAGIVVAIFRRERRPWLWLLLVPLSCHLTFTWVALYTNDRYLFGGVLVLALFAGASLWDLVEVRVARTVARAVGAASLAFSFLNAASVNAMMTRDARDVARRWVTERAGIGTVVGTLGMYVPPFAAPIRTVTLDDAAQARAVHPPFVVVNARFARTLADAGLSRWNSVAEGLRDGSLGYAEAFRYRSPLPAWAVLQYEAPFLSSVASDLTNLDKINPETVVYVTSNAELRTTPRAHVR